MKIKVLKQHLKFMYALSRAKLAGKNIPLIAILGLTNKCNLNCWYCYGEHPFRKDWKDFSTQELLGIIRELHGLGTLILQLQGGEPLIRNDLEPLIREAKRLGMVCDMVTNGVLIPQRLEIIRLLDKICISLDGPRLLNDRNRGEGTFDQVLSGIQCACRTGIPVRISAVLTEDTTIEDIEWLISFCRKNGLLVNFSPSFDFVGQLTESGFKPHVISDEKLRILFKHILSLKNKYGVVQFSAKSYAWALQWPFEYSQRTAQDISGAWGRQARCYHGDYIIFIDSDGSVYPCCNFWGRKSLNLRKNGLKASIDQLDRQGCTGCYIPAYIDRNLFFKGDLKTWFNYIRQGIRGDL
jgi:MoaA/NifB/PqqE/SkfB family radical SAM enzyme